MRLFFIKLIIVIIAVTILYSVRYKLTNKKTKKEMQLISEANILHNLKLIYLILNLHDMVSTFQLAFSEGNSKRIKESANEYDPFYMVLLRNEIDKIIDLYFSKKSKLDYEFLEKYINHLKTLLFCSAVLDEDINQFYYLEGNMKRMYLEIQNAETEISVMRVEVIELKTSLCEELKGIK